MTGTEVTEITGKHRETEQRRTSPYKQDDGRDKQPLTGTRTQRFQLLRMKEHKVDLRFSASLCDAVSSVTSV